jgi:hypothetical protein
MKSKTIENLATVSFGEDKILRLKFLKGSHIDVEEAHQCLKLSTDVTEKVLHADLVDTSEMAYMSRDAREIFAKEDRSDVICMAIIINSKLQTMLGNMYMKFNNPKIHTKIFEGETEAVNWLKEEIKKRGI